MFRRRKKPQIRIQHQTSSSSKKRFLFIFFLLLLIVGGILILNQKNSTPISSDILVKDKKESQQKVQPKKPSFTDKEIQKQIQEDYKSNLLKRQMSEDEARHKKNKYIPKGTPVDESYTLKDGVDLSQDESFDNLLSILKEAEEETDEDIEDRIARYHIIEKKIQNFQGVPNPNNKQEDTEIDQKQIFAQKFIENARKGGYEVKLDNNFKVKSVKKIKPNPYEEASSIEEND